MPENTRDERRSKTGFGSTYGRWNDRAGINAVLGGQAWKVTPDKTASFSKPCIWMQAAVVKNKNCNKYFDCTSCKYDLGMKKKVAAGKQRSWQEHMRLRPDIERVCRHSMTGRIGARLCAYDYQCGKCDFDQMFEDVLSAKATPIAGETTSVRGFAMPMDYYFHDGHTWARVESGGFIRIGMDDFTGKVFGKADGFELPLIGKELDSGEIGWGLKRTRNLADVRSPIGGVIVEVNPNIHEHPDTTNRDPYEEGWLFTVRTPDIKKSVKQLLTDKDSLGWMNGEVGRLEAMIEDTAGPMATDGGFLIDDIFGNLPDLGWTNLSKAFLKTG